MPVSRRQDSSRRLSQHEHHGGIPRAPPRGTGCSAEVLKRTHKSHANDGRGRMALDALKGWSSAQKHVVAASYLGWTLDAFDFFLLVFVIKDVAGEFGTPISNIALAVTLTLALRPVGAFM